MPHSSPRRALASFLLFLVGDLATAQSLADRFTKTTAMVTMRDGARLNTEVYTPKGAAGTLPMLLERTPYSIRHDRDGIAASIGGSYAELAQSGYIFVFQDIRGKYGSDGEFVMVRPPRHDGQTIDEGTDAFDTIAWLLANVPGHNGRVGMLGISYGGWLTMQALLEPHPALRAASPQASPDCMWCGDDFHHNGAFRLSYGFEYAAAIDSGKQTRPFQFDRACTYDWFLALGGLGDVDDRYFQGKCPTWTDYVAHPDFDGFWQRRKVAPWFADRPITVPTLTVAGWWDQEDFYGPLTLYAAMERNDRNGLNHLVVGPWNHGGWAHGKGDSLGAIKFGSDTAAYYRGTVQRHWFDHWLKDQGERDFAEALTFRPGTNEWVRHDRWPPTSGVAPARLFLRAGGKLAFEPPSPGEPASTRFLSDPDKPVPYRQLPIRPLYGGKVNGKWPEWQVDDQRHSSCRPDVLVFESAVLDRDVTVCGDLLARLQVCTSGTDADWIVKLIDVFPEDCPGDQTMAGYQLMVMGDVFRSRYRQGFDKPVPMEPGEVTEIALSLHQADYTFLKGHTIMVQVQSTWFPLIDRNPQQFVPNIYQANDDAFTVQEHQVFHDGEHNSCLELSILR